jgi:type 1 glutamine amidotransferase/HEAT repeat protein
VTLGLAILMTGLMAQRAFPAVEPARLRVLIFSGLNNHDWRSTTPVIKKMLTDCARFGTVDVTEDPAGLTAATLARYDVLVSNWTPYPETRRSWRPETEAAFLDFVRRGGGFVVIHAAACTFQPWPEFQQLIALTWKADYTAHGTYHTFKVSVEDQAHPIARGLTDFYTTDELYHQMVQMTEPPLHVVFKAFSAKDQAGTGRHEPVLVCTELGRGRGVNLVLGHDAAAMGAGFGTLLLRSAEWAASGQVTLPPPAIWPSTPAAMAAAGLDLNATLSAVARYRYGDERKPLCALQELVRYANSLAGNDPQGFRGGLADRMVVLLASPDATLAGKVFVCGQLADIATEKQAAAVNALLANKQIAADAALPVLERIPGPAVDRMLRDALGTLDDDLRIKVVLALGTRRDRAATEPLIAMLAGADEPLGGAVADALGRIGGDAAAKALQKALAGAKGRLRTEVVAACLTCAEGLLAEGQHASAAKLYLQLSGAAETEQVRMAALRGTVRSSLEQGISAVCAALTSGDPALESMALRLVPELPGRAATEQLAQLVPKASGPVQALLLGALAARRDVAARGAVQAALSNEDPAVRLAAVNALGTLGDATSVNGLIDRTRAGVATAERQAARNSLVRLRGPGINEVLIGLLSQDNPSQQTELIRILAARNAVSSLPALETAAEAPDAAVRKEAWKALGNLARTPDLAALLELLVRVRDEDRDEAEKAVGAVLGRPERPDLRAVLQKLETVETPAARSSLIRLVSAVGDDSALPALRKAVQSGDAGVRDAAVRGLAAWPTPAPFADLVNLARASAEPVHRVLALRAAIRLSSKATGRTPEQMTGLVTELMQMAGATAERKAVLTELGRCPTLAALRLAQKSLADPELATEAGLAVTQIASALRDTHRDQVLAALQLLLAGNRDAAIAARAFKVLKDILKPVNLALGATATSPDGLDSDGASGGDKAAIDGYPNTYWDEVDNADLYRLKVTLKEPQDVSAINILWHPYEQHQAKDLDVLCDGKVVAEVRKAKCFEHEMFIAFPLVRCTSVELAIPGKNGLVSPAIHELQIFSRVPPQSTGSGGPRRTDGPPPPPKYGWKQTDAALALLNHDRVVWQCNYGANQAKPYFHPVGLTDGTILTAPSPADHPWHRALWFSWKMLNGVNYWEEDAATGKAQGLSEVRSAKLTSNADGSARIEFELSYHPPETAPVLTENRLIEVSAPDERGVYRLDWRGTFAAGDKEVLLQGGTAGGGYAGLSVRVSQATGDWVLIDSEGRRDVATDHAPGNTAGLAVNTHGQRARWADFSLIDIATQQPCGIAILAHPLNPRHPSPWHNILAAGGRFGYFSPAMLWSEPFTLAAGQRFTLRYRVLIHPGRADREAIEREWQAFASRE